LLIFSELSAVCESVRILMEGLAMQELIPS
jgi:hypothetical protein